MKSEESVDLLFLIIIYNNICRDKINGGNQNENPDGDIYRNISGKYGNEI